VLGRMAARRAGIPVVAVSRGWTAEKLRVRFYEAVDRLNLRWMDHVVCVSDAQAEKVRRAGVPAECVSVIRNAIRVERFDTPDAAYRDRLRGFFPTPPARIVGAAGRLSPEKGFQVLVDAASRVRSRDASIGFVLFGDGPLRGPLEEAVRAAGLGASFILAGFRDDMDSFLPFLDLFVLPSFTEGLPNVVLEAFAAQVPVVATAVGGTPEVVEDAVSGHLVPAGDATALAERILDVLASEARRREMGRRGHQRVVNDFSFAAQSRQYRALFERLTRPSRRPPQWRETDQLCESIR
jgi:glycosyltransferase involved in cell wall biosynthesis